MPTLIVRAIAAGAVFVGFGAFAVLARADGSPEAAEAAASAAASGHPHRRALARVRDPLAIDPTLAVKDTPTPEIDLPGVMKIEGANKDLLDPSRARRISWTNAGSQTVYVSVDDVNRIQLPFPNPHVAATNELEVDKRPNSNNVYVHFAAGVTRAVQIWLEPQGASSVSIGLQLVPKHIPGQYIVVVDDTPAVPNAAPRAPGSGDEYLARVQNDLEAAASGLSPEGWSVEKLEVPLVALNGLVVEGVRRLSNRSEDLYVYSVTNPGAADVTLREQEFDGETVLAVSILPTPLLHPGQKTLVTVLARKHEGVPQ